MATIVQSASVTSSGNTNLAFVSNNTAGNFLIIAVSALTTGQTFSVTDTAGNSYKNFTAVTDSVNTVESQIFYVPSCLAGANTVTFTPGAAVTTIVAIHEFSGVKGFNVSGSALGVSTSITSPAIQISAGFSFGFISGVNSGSILTLSPGTGWTQAEASVATPPFLTEWRTDGGVIVATGAYTGSKGGTLAWTAQLASLGRSSQSPLGSFGFTQWTGW